MCGIAGIVRRTDGPPIEPELLQKMARRMAHRGPDEGSIWYEGPVGLAHRRLSVIDPSASKQPMESADGRYILSYNGEIYNFKELRAKLGEDQFRYRGDTEVLLVGWHRWGVELFGKLHGMFAFAIWDREEKKLIIARDRLGQKPLYYSLNGENKSIIFGSEIKSILASIPTEERKLSPESLHQYFTLQYVPGEATLLEGIKRLSAAHWLEWKNGDLSIHRYWAPGYFPKHEGPARKSTETAPAGILDELEQRIGDAVEARLVSDVPLGCFLSGGIDSTLVSLLAKERGGAPPETYSIRFEEAAFDESETAAAIARGLGANHHVETVAPQAAEIAPRLAWHFDDLMGDPSAIPQWYLAEFARREITVALSGDGGDESLAGYTRYFGLPQLRGRDGSNAINNLLGSALWLGGSALTALGGSEASWGKLRQGGRLLLRPPEERYAQAMSLYWPGLIDEILEPAWRTPDDMPAPSSFLRRAMDQGGARDPLDRYAACDIHTYLPGDLLPKVDRMTMAHGLEARSPFLDHQLVEWCARLPAAWKAEAGQPSKILARRLLARAIEQGRIDAPASTPWLAKRGFAVPLDEWFRGPLRTWGESILFSDRTRDRGIFNERGLRQLWRTAQGRNWKFARHGHRLWIAILFELWCRTYLDSDGASPIELGG